MDGIYCSNRLEDLCKKLADNIKKSSDGIFKKDVIITQTTGMNVWLKTELAKQSGVFANFEFQNQDGFFKGIYKLLFNESLKNNFDTIKYKIFDLLNNTDFINEYNDVAEYYKDNDLRRFHLAEKIADLFDQYQLYRPEMIEEWSKGGTVIGNQSEKWQRWLFNELKIYSKEQIKKELIKSLADNQKVIKETYPQISLFGITIYTKFHLEFFKKLAEYTNVNFYLCVPAKENEFRNDLLESFGNKSKELIDMFNFKDCNQDIEIIKNSNNTLLATIQQQIAANSINSRLHDDDSIQINSCHTPIREAECLYNYLLDLFEKDHDLNPKDILVITTDINKYATFIKAVFMNAAVKIPFQVSGAANNSDDSIIAALEQILSFTEEDFTSEKVISLLEQKRIKQNFQVEDCNYIRSVVRKANIRFGINNLSEDDTRYVSWEYGLEKILLGYAMLTDDEYHVEDGITLYPFKDSEASASFDLLKLKAFVKKLEFILNEQTKQKTLAEWKKFLIEEVLDSLIYHDDFNKNDRAEIASIKRILSFVDNLVLDKELPFLIFLDELKSKLFAESRESKLNTGRVTISSPIPVRGIPYKIICFLGLNNDTFPRKDSFMGFDLLGTEYRMGDRNKKETDKNLFLETILAARERLYLSYIGQSVKDNTEIPPSIVLDTLMDYMGKEVSKKILVKHPLHGFSKAYQKPDDPRMFTYLYADKPTGFDVVAPEQKNFEEISVYSFVRFFENPVEWYFNEILGVHYKENDDTIDEMELFELDALQKWHVKTKLLNLKGKAETDSFIKKGIKEGQLPLKNLGHTTVDDLSTEIYELKTKYNELTSGKEEKSVLVDVNVPGERKIKGTINNIFERKYIAYAFSDTPKYMVRAYLNALLLFLQNEIDSFSFIFLKNKQIHTEEFAKIYFDEAVQKLKQLMIYFNAGITNPLKFTPDAAKRIKKKEKVENIFKKEADGDENASIPANRCVKNLFEEGYFEDFNIESFSENNFDPMVYDETRFDEIKNIAKLFNQTVK